MTLIQDKESDIFYRCWKAREPQTALLLVHGLGAHSGRWEALGEFFQRNNISSYALELKGFGQTQGERGDIDDFNIYFRDIGFLYDIIKRDNPGKKIFLLGESMGALICFLYAALSPQFFSGLVCVSPSFVSRLRFSFWQYLSIWLALIFNPKRHFPVPIAPEMCTRDIEYQKIIEADILDKHIATARLYWNILKAQNKSGAAAGKINIPILILTAGDDTVVDSSAARRIFESLKVKDKVIIDYPAMRHALSIELEREKVFEDILSWIGRSR